MCFGTKPKVLWCYKPLCSVTQKSSDDFKQTTKTKVTKVVGVSVPLLDHAQISEGTYRVSPVFAIWHKNWSKGGDASFFTFLSKSTENTIIRLHCRFHVKICTGYLIILVL